MAEKVIGLRIQLNGFNGVVTSIKQLEEELKKAKEDLTQLEIGSNNFKSLQGEISRTEGKLIGLRKASEGIGLEKQLEGYGKLAGGITSSFAAAQSAVALFGNESTLVAEAAAQAQNILTLALSARGIQEVAVGAEIVARTVAEKAATAATLTTNAALKTLYTTIAANPIGALVVAIGLLIAAVVTFNSETEETIDVEKELGKVTSEAASKLELYGKILRNTNTSNRERAQIVRELKKDYPGFNALLTEENRLNLIGEAYIKAKTQALIVEAQTKMIVQKIAENNNKIILEENKSVEESVTGWQKFTNTLLGASSGYGTIGTQVLNAKDAINNNKKATSDLKDENVLLEKTLDKLLNTQSELNDVIDPAEKLMKKFADAEKESAKQTDKSAEALERRKQALNDLVELLGEQAKLEAQILVTQTNIGDADTNIIKGYQDKVTAADGYVKKLEELKTVSKNLADFELLFQIDESSIDRVGDAFRTVRDAGEAYYDAIKNKSGDTQKAIDNLNKVLAEQKEKVKDVITNEQSAQLDKYVFSYKQLTQAVELFASQKIEPPFDAKSFERDIIDLALLTQKIKIDPFAQDIEKRPFEKMSMEILDAQERIQKDEEKFVKAYAKFRQTENKAQYDALLELSKQSTDEGKAAAEAVKKLNSVYEEAGKIAFKNLSDAATQTVVFEYGVEATTLKVVSLVEELKKLAPAAREGFILANKEQITQQYEIDLDKIKLNKEDYLRLSKEIQTKSYDSSKSFGLQVENLQKELGDKGIKLEGLSYAAKLELLKSFNEKQIKETTDVETKKQEQYKKTLDSLNLALQTISKSLSDVASLVAQSFQIELDSLEYRYQEAMGNIVGDTEEANQKRIETEKAYQSEKAQIERKAQLASLKFTLASALASGAQAIVAALALPPPASFIIAGINAGITAVQVGLIQTQINDLQSRPLRRGGLLQGGGLVSGPSHEQGGVYAGGGYTLEGNEAVINRQSTLQYSGLLSQINQSGGGRPIMVQSAMDSRLVEALAKQKTEPIRAYVVEQDITRAQTINRRLEQLASF